MLILRAFDGSINSILYPLTSNFRQPKFILHQISPEYKSKRQKIPQKPLEKIFKICYNRLDMLSGSKLLRFLPLAS